MYVSNPEIYNKRRLKKKKKLIQNIILSNQCVWAMKARLII